MKIPLFYSVSIILMISGFILWVKATDSSTSIPGKLLFGVGVVLAMIGDFYRTRNYGVWRWFRWKFSFEGVIFTLVGVFLMVLKLTIIPDVMGWGLLGLLIAGGVMLIFISKQYKDP